LKNGLAYQLQADGFVAGKVSEGQGGCDLKWWIVVQL